VNTKKTTPATTTLQRYHYLKGKLLEAEKKKEIAESEVRACEFQITLFQTWIEELQEEVCPECGGHGRIRVFAAQDEVQKRTCTRCKGSGVIETEE
jgi:DnaJ-class molecular chaperone